MEEQQQTPPGSESELTPKADHGETSYRGCGKLQGKATLITGGDSGIGKAVAIAFAREGADVLISYLPEEEEDAQDTARWVQEAGRRCVLAPGDLASPDYCRSLVDRAFSEFGKLDVLVNNAAHQMSFQSIEEIPDEEWDHTFAVNITAMFHICKAAAPRMTAGGSIINTSSVNSDKPSPQLLAYATTKGAIANFSAGLAQMLGERNIRVNSVAPGPVWTPLIPSTMPPEKVKSFGEDTPLKRPAQPKEMAPIYVLLASDEASYITGARYAATGGTPIL